MVSILSLVAVNVVRTWTYLYQFITWPIYKIFQYSENFTPIESNIMTGRLLAQPVIEDNPASPWRNVEALNTLSRSIIPGTETLDDLFTYASSKYTDCRALGTRELLESSMEKQPNGKVFKKLTYGKYYWETFAEVDKRIDNFGKGLLNLGLKSGADNILLFAETRAEWMIAAQAGFRFNFPIVTLYSTLGEDAIVHGINESETTLVITSDELLPKLTSVIERCPLVQHIIFMNHAIFNKRPNGEVALKLIENFKHSINNNKLMIHEMTEIELAGQKFDCQSQGDVTIEIFDVASYKPSRKDLAIIMYTSGSTGVPKGVMLTHGNLMSAMAGQSEGLPEIGLHFNDVYVGYLPLAHALELCCENVVLSGGIPIGYSSPQTLTDQSTKIKQGTKGDIRVLKPTLMACVPTILDRITKSVWEKAADNGPLFLDVFKWIYSYRKRRVDRGYPSVFMDKLLFRKIKKLLGGKVRYMLSGGAPIREEAQNFINFCFCPIIQGYGLTETCGAGTLMAIGDRRNNQVGAPLNCLEIKLREWKEGGYSPFDQPKPRGEVLIGGECVAAGYYKQDGELAQDFIVDDEGKRWLCTGDIGVFHSDGSMSIIDRKKDLVKLQGGEYVSLAKVELAMLQCPIIESVCVIGNSLHEYLVCIVSPKRKQLTKLAERAGVTPTNGSREIVFEDACANEKVKSELLRQLQQVCREKKLERMEIPTKICLDTVQWLPDTGLVTEALKLKRKNIQQKFQKQIDEMYGE